MHFRTILALAIAAGLSGCGSDESTVEALLAAHERAEPRMPSTLRIVADAEGQGQRARIVTVIRREPFGYREDVSPSTGQQGPTLSKFRDGRLVWRPQGGRAGEPLTGNEARGFLVRAFVEGRRWLAPEGRHGAKLRG